MSRQFPVMRGLAIVFVILNHSISMSLWLAYRYELAQPSQPILVLLVALKQIGLYAVPIFLFLSGAFFAYAVNNRSLSNAYRVVWHNLVGIIWPYLIWSIAFYTTTWLLLGDKSTLLQYGKNLLVGYPYDFVPLLIFFYVLAPLLTWAGKRAPVLMITLIFIYQLVVADINNPAMFGFEMPAWTSFLAMPVIRSGFALWAIFFPLGNVYQQHMSRFAPLLAKFWAVFIAGAIIFYVLDVLTELSMLVNFPLSSLLSPLFGLLLTPVLRREVVPFCRWIENIGKKSYGLYLSNLVIITLLLFGIRLVLPWLLTQYLILVPLLFTLVVLVNKGLTTIFEKPPQRVLYRYIFG